MRNAAGMLLLLGLVILTLSSFRVPPPTVPVWEVPAQVVPFAYMKDMQAPLTVFTVTSDVGYRKNPMGGGETNFHKGLDMVGPPGALVHAANRGVVVEHWPPPGGGFRGHPSFGGMVVIDHGNGTWTLYGHMSRTLVHEGQAVAKGEVIGVQGATGDATGPHLHFEVVTDPRLLMEED